MTGVDEREVQHDIETPASIQIRFGIEFLAASLADATVVMSMPMSVPSRRRAALPIAKR